MAKSKVPAPPDATPRPDAEYTVVARRYRPQQLADLIGQEHVAAALTNALNSGRIAHAYLFTGARGVGKTSTARILAKALNCVTGPTPTPCDACDICKSIMNGDDVDTVEIDGASNRKIEDARDLKSGIGFRPQRARFKIYIIDEVHMLTREAFNALLKTLEEPPSHVKFVFATTEVQKIPITILSRCQRFDFASIGPAKVFETLKHIVKKEGLRADDDSLHLVARRAAGSMRDAQTLLDQLLGFSEGRLTVEKVHQLLGTAEDDRVAELAAAILSRDAKAALDHLAAAVERGLQLGELLDQLVEYWRGLMLVLVAGEGAHDLPGTPSLHEVIRKHAATTNLDTVLAGLDVLTAAKAKLRGSPHVQVLVEVAVVRLSRMDELLSVSQLAQMVASPGTTPAPSTRTLAADPSKKNSPVSPNGIHTNGIAARPAMTVVGGDADFSVLWERVLQEIGPMLRATLQTHASPATLGPNSLAIRFPADYSSAYDAGAIEEAVRRVLRHLTQKEWNVRVERQAALAGTSSQPATPPPRQERTKDLLQLPLFKKAVEALGAQLVRVDEGFNPTPPAATTDEG